jgi:hypothetical protein
MSKEWHLRNTRSSRHAQRSCGLSLRHWGSIQLGQRFNPSDSTQTNSSRLKRKGRVERGWRPSNFVPSAMRCASDPMMSEKAHASAKWKCLHEYFEGSSSWDPNVSIYSSSEAQTEHRISTGYSLKKNPITYFEAIKSWDFVETDIQMFKILKIKQCETHSHEMENLPVVQSHPTGWVHWSWQ